MLTVAGSSRYRLPPGDEGFRNLFLSGDWTDNHLNYGCVEAAIMGRLLLANALADYPKGGYFRLGVVMKRQCRVSLSVASSLKGKGQGVRKLQLFWSL